MAMFLASYSGQVRKGFEYRVPRSSTNTRSRVLRTACSSGRVGTAQSTITPMVESPGPPCSTNRGSAAGLLLVLRMRTTASWMVRPLGSACCSGTVTYPQSDLAATASGTSKVLQSTVCHAAPNLARAAVAAWAAGLPAMTAPTVIPSSMKRGNSARAGFAARMLQSRPSSAREGAVIVGFSGWCRSQGSVPEAAQLPLDVLGGLDG